MENITKRQSPHLDKYNVKVGDRVKAGDIIAYSGNTGIQTTGAHLHFPNQGWCSNAYTRDPKPVHPSVT